MYRQFRVGADFNVRGEWVHPAYAQLLGMYGTTILVQKSARNHRITFVFRFIGLPFHTKLRANRICL